MSTYAECLEVLPHFRNRLLQQHVAHKAFGAAGRTSLDYATGITTRRRPGEARDGESVLRLFVFEESEVEIVADQVQDFGGLPVEVGHLRIPAAGAIVDPPPGQSALPTRPIGGGVSIGPHNTQIEGTLACFVSRISDRGAELFALSANHVLSNGDLLRFGTPILHPGRGRSGKDRAYAFASLSETITTKFDTDPRRPSINYYDAALAAVTAPLEGVLTGAIMDITLYDPGVISVATPGMEVTKCGAATGVTEGVVDTIGIGLLPVDYPPRLAPRRAVFDRVFLVRGVDRGKFADKGDSGAVILEKSTGHPVGLLFATDDEGWATACDFGGLCQTLGVTPV